MTNTEEQKMPMLSDYVGTLRNGKYINAERLINAIEAHSTSPKDKLFAKVFPTPNYFTVATGNGSFDVRKHETRTAAADHRKNDSSIRSHRDYFILDVDVFEDFIDNNVDMVSYLRTPSGFDSGKKVGSKFYTPEYLASLSPEEAVKVAQEMSKARLERPKRTMSEEHREKVTAALAKARKEKTKTKK